LDALLQDSPKYWTDGSYDDWLGEMAGARLIIERFANITDGSVIGVRAPYLRVGGNVQFEMMADQGGTPCQINNFLKSVNLLKNNSNILLFSTFHLHLASYDYL
jgi:hypothetical protein